MVFGNNDSPGRDLSPDNAYSEQEDSPKDSNSSLSTNLTEFPFSSISLLDLKIIAFGALILFLLLIKWMMPKVPLESSLAGLKTPLEHLFTRRILAVFLFFSFRKKEPSLMSLLWKSNISSSASRPASHSSMSIQFSLSLF